MQTAKGDLRGGSRPAALVNVRVGPLPMDAARAFIAGAATGLSVARALPNLTVPEPVWQSFHELVATWTDCLSDDDTFDWRSTLPVAEVRLLATHWAAVAAALRGPGNHAETWDPPAEARPFYDALVVAVAAALADDDAERFAPTFVTAVPAFDERHPEITDHMRVLVVDDTEDIRLLTGVTLGIDGRFEVCGEARDGVEAIEQAGRLQPDAVLLDLSMPRMDGLTALPRIREICPRARIIVFSADIDAEARALAAGADGFVAKGSQREVLSSVLAGR